MLNNIIKNRWRQGYRTMKFPAYAPLPEPYRGKPVLDTLGCIGDCRKCVEVCPTGAISTAPLRIDLGKCLFCEECARACPNHVISFSRDYRMSVRKRDDLILKDSDIELAASLDKKMKRFFGRSLKLREVCAGGCNACDADINVLNTVGFDLSRFGIQIVASPRHADGLVVTGPVTENMKLALMKTYEAVSDPKLVIVVGACAISGGGFEGSPVCNDGVDELLPVDLYIPGCPPHPLTILNGFLRLVGKIRA